MALHSEQTPLGEEFGPQIIGREDVLHHCCCAHVGTEGGKWASPGASLHKRSSTHTASAPLRQLGQSDHPGTPRGWLGQRWRGIQNVPEAGL